MKLRTTATCAVFFVLTTASAMADTIVHGTGQIYTAVGANVKLIGNFGGIIVGADNIHLDLSTAAIQCSGDVGIDMVNRYGVNITGGSISQCWIGIGILGGGRNQITGLTSTGHGGFGIILDGSSNNRITAARLNGHSYGILATNASNNNITGSVISNSADHGIWVMFGTRNSITGNVVTGGLVGIEFMYGSVGNSATANRATHSTLDVVDTNPCGSNAWRGNSYASSSGVCGR